MPSIEFLDRDFLKRTEMLPRKAMLGGLADIGLKGLAHPKRRVEPFEKVISLIHEALCRGGKKGPPVLIETRRVYAEKGIEHRLLICTE